MKIFWIILLILILLLAIIEGGLRLFLGLGKRPVYIADAEIGYLLAPNQQIHRFGKKTIINQYSMRSEPIEKQRSQSTLRIFLLGDSIANGAWWTDQSETISELIKKQLKSPNFSKIELLNASANSWGPRNQLAYLRHFSTFESQFLVLLLNTDDLFASAPNSFPVGRDRNYPNRQAMGALGELFEQFFGGNQNSSERAKILPEKGDIVGINLKAIAEIKAISRDSQSQLIVAITPLLREVDGSEIREYESKARLRLQEFSQREGIPLIDFLPLFKTRKSPETLYRDNIHLSPEGNQLVSQKIAQFIHQNDQSNLN